MSTLTTDQAASLLGVTPSRVRVLIRNGRLPAQKFGRAHVINENDLKLVADRPVGRPKATQATPAPEKRATGAARARNGTAPKKKGGKK
jgi:excisionase family DNA binding protein